MIANGFNGIAGAAMLFCLMAGLAKEHVLAQRTPSPRLRSSSFVEASPERFARGRTQREFLGCLCDLCDLCGKPCDSFPEGLRYSQRVGRKGPVRLSGTALVDDEGEFHALGATMMWALWAFKFDRDRLERNLAFLSTHGFDYIRALGQVGGEWWKGREIDPRWPDYDETIAGLTDLAYDKYGLRVEWTIFGSADLIPERERRVTVVDQFLAMSKSRAPKIIHFETANEAWHTGFFGDEGLRDLRSLTKYLNDRTDILVAASAPDRECPGLQELYAGGIADLATVHFDRETGKADGRWRPIRQPWNYRECSNVPIVASNNEPIGPGSSVREESDPLRLVAAAVATYMSKLPLYVYHTDPGVRGDTNLWEVPADGSPSASRGLEIARAFAAMKRYLPSNLSNWERHAHDSPGHPFSLSRDGHGQIWPEGAGQGVVRAFASVSANRFLVFPMGIKDFVTLRAKRALEAEALNPVTGEIAHRYILKEGESIELRGIEAVVIQGRWK